MSCKLIAVGQIDPTSSPLDRQEYSSGAAQAIAVQGGSVSFRSQEIDVLIGHVPASIVLVADFPSRDAGRAFWSSAEYKALEALRNRVFSDLVMFLA